MDVVTFWSVLLLAALGIFIVALNGRAIVELRKDDPPMRAHYTRQLGAAAVLGSGAMLTLVGLFVAAWLVLVGGLLAAGGYRAYFAEQRYGPAMIKDRIAYPNRSELPRHQARGGGGMANTMFVLMAAASIGYFFTHR